MEDIILRQRILAARREIIAQMNVENPVVSCLCPTFRRTARLLANSVACFEQQTYPSSLRELIILDDAGLLTEKQVDNWKIVSVNKRYTSLPDKYNALLKLAGPVDIIVVWEDDDIYLPWHIQSVVESVVDFSVKPKKPKAAWSHPKNVWSLYGGEIHQEGAAGRFHASLGFCREALDRIGGWPDTERGDFDQQLISKLRSTYGPPGDPCESGEPGYVFRWETTGGHHGQAFMRSPEDTGWYVKFGTAAKADGVEKDVIPKFDDETKKVYETVDENHLKK